MMNSAGTPGSGRGAGRAGVAAGAGGRYPAAGGEPQQSPDPFLPLSAKSGTALGELAERYMSWLDDRSKDSSLADMAWTAGVGRSHFDHRTGLAFTDADSLRAGLAALAEDGEDSEPRAATRVAFVYTGQGSQWAGMGRDLYESEPVARAVLDRCEEVFREARGASLLDVMFGRPSGRGTWATRRGNSLPSTPGSAR